MDALARLKLPGVNFSFNAPFPSALALISQTSLQGSGAALPALSRPVGEPNFNASEKGQTWSCYHFADHFAPVRETPQDITTPFPSFPFITSHRPNSPLYRFTLSPKSWNWKLERASRDSRSRGESFERSMVRVAASRKWLHLHHCCWKQVRVLGGRGSFRRERGGVFSTPLSLLDRYLLGGNEFLSENSRGNVLRSNDFREHRGFDH